MNIHDRTPDYLFSGVHHGAGEARILPVRRQAYLLADLPDGRPNPNTHAYGHCELAAEEHLMADQPELGAELIIRYPEERFARRHARVTKRLELAGAIKMEDELPDGDADGELHGDQLLLAERVAAARSGGAIRMGDVIERIIPATISSGLLAACSNASATYAATRLAE